MATTNKNKMVAVHMTDELIKRIEAFTAKSGKNRSEVIRELIIDSLDRHEIETRPFSIKIIK